MAWCFPCVPYLGPVRHQRIAKRIGLMTLHQEIWRKIQSRLTSLDLAMLCQVAPELHQDIHSQRLVQMLGLHALHIFDAPFLSFAWVGAGRLASGEDGWETLLGSVALSETFPAARWMLEVLSLKSLLSVGVAYEQMASNALLGSKTSVASWGWDISPKGWVETICSEDGFQRSQQLEALERGGLGKGRMILVFHLKAKQMPDLAQLDLAILSFQQIDGQWQWRWKDLRLPHEVPVRGIRPAVSVDLGAAVRVLCNEVFEDSYQSSSEL